MKSIRGTWIFTLVVILLSLYSYFGVFKKQNEDKEKKEQSSKLIQTKFEDIAEISLTRDSDTLVLEKKDADWFIKLPAQDRADLTRVQNFVDLIAREKTSQLVEDQDGADLKVYGLVPPQTTLILKAKNGVEEKLEFGGVRAYDSSLYVKLNSKKEVYTTSGFLDSNFIKKPDDFLSRKIWLADESKIQKILIHFKDQNIEIEKVAEGEQKHWKLIKPQKTDFDFDEGKVQNYLHQLQNITVNDFADKDPKFNLKVAQKKELYTLKFIDSDQKSFEMKLYDHNDFKNPMGGFDYIQSSDLKKMAQINHTTALSMQKKLIDFLDTKKAFQFKMDELSSLEFKLAKSKIRIEKSANTWKLLEPQGRELDLEVLTEVLKKLPQLEIQDESKKSASKLALKFENEISLQDKNHKEILAFSWGMPYGDEQLEKMDKSTPKAEWVDIYLKKLNKSYKLKAESLTLLNLASILKEKAEASLPDDKPKVKPEALHAEKQAESL